MLKSVVYVHQSSIDIFLIKIKKERELKEREKRLREKEDQLRQREEEARKELEEARKLIEEDGGTGN